MARPIRGGVPPVCLSKRSSRGHAFCNRPRDSYGSSFKVMVDLDWAHFESWPVRGRGASRARTCGAAGRGRRARGPTSRRRARFPPITVHVALCAKVCFWGGVRNALVAFNANLPAPTLSRPPQQLSSYDGYCPLGPALARTRLAQAALGQVCLLGGHDIGRIARRHSGPGWSIHVANMYAAARPPLVLTVRSQNRTAQTGCGARCRSSTRRGRSTSLSRLQDRTCFA